ncbi:MAG: MBL fold metallo-hydrolase [Gemmatimonadales bacterium]|jgi:glyoxylase-like metal-dependent hydrolase (beta-lactamase superfamily II)
MPRSPSFPGIAVRGARCAALSIVLPVLLLWPGAGAAVAQPRPDVEFTELRPGALLVRVVSPDGSRLGANMVVLATESGTVLVDTNLPHPQLARLVRRAVEDRVGALSAVVVTHWHPDHSGGIEAYADLPVYAHAGTIRRLSEETVGVDLGRLGGRFTSPPRTPEGRPDHAADEGERLAGGALVLHHPANAHTDGDLYVEWPERNLVVMADLLWPGRFPSVDVHNGGTAAGLRDAVREVLRLGDEDTLYVPGHGDPTARAAVEAYSDMLERTIDVVNQRAADGDPLDEIVADGPLSGWGKWAHALVPERQWIKLIYLSRSD